MQTITETLTAGQWVTLPCDGRFFMLLESAGGVDLRFRGEGRGTNDICEGITAGFKYQAARQMTSVMMRSATGGVVKYAYADGTGGYDRSVIVAEQAVATDNEAPVTLGTSAALALAGDATRRRLILTAHRDNAGAIALGGPALTSANAARWLEAGESYIETDAAPAAVYALAETAGDVLCVEVA